jgi:TatD DNase family protein
MYIDTHAHVNFNAYKDDADEVIRRALAEDVHMILVGSEYRTSKRALEFAHKFQRGVYAAVGFHPIHLEDSSYEDQGREITVPADVFNYDMFEKLASFEKVVAIGEIGLDYHHIRPTADVRAVKAKQKEVFWEQLKLALKTGLPIIIHCRQAHDDMLEILGDFRQQHRDQFDSHRPWGVMHCFSGDEDLAWKYFSLGLLISFTGIVTFSRQWDDLIRKMPQDKFLLETDCPYLTPEPYRGSRNEPVLVKYVADKIADIRKTTPEKVAEITTRNALELFKI